MFQSLGLQRELAMEFVLQATFHHKRVIIKLSHEVLVCDAHTQL